QLPRRGVCRGVERLEIRGGAAADGGRVLPGVGAAGRAPQPQARPPARLAGAVARLGQVAPDGRGRPRRPPRPAAAARGGGPRAAPSRPGPARTHRRRRTQVPPLASGQKFKTNLTFRAGCPCSTTSPPRPYTLPHRQPRPAPPRNLPTRGPS